MAPFLGQEAESVPRDVINDNIKSKSKNLVINSSREETDEKPPVADDFMYDFKYNHPLPTTNVLGVEIPASCDAQKEAEGIVEKISEAMSKGDAQAFTDLFLKAGQQRCHCHGNSQKGFTDSQ